MSKKLIDRFAQCVGGRVLIVGDLVADQYIYTRAARVSREAPVLVLEYENDRLSLGGAANAAHNVQAMGGQAMIVGVVGADEFGDATEAELKAKGIDTRFLVRDPHHSTIVKQRFVASGLHTTYQQMLRLDRGIRGPAAAEVQNQLLAGIDEAAGMCQALIASDYGYGVFTEEVITRVSAIGQAEWCPVLVDSRSRMLQFQGAHLLTPNEPEAAEACHMTISNDREVMAAAERVLLGANAAAVAVTRGKQGMYLLEKNRPGRFLSIYGTDEIADVTGAGDTVIAAFALAAAAGLDFYDAACMATVAAGLVVLKHGTAVVTQNEIRQALEADPWLES